MSNYFQKEQNLKLEINKLFIELISNISNIGFNEFKIGQLYFYTDAIILHNSCLTNVTNAKVLFGKGTNLSKINDEFIPVIIEQLHKLKLPINKIGLKYAYYYQQQSIKNIKYISELIDKYILVCDENINILKDENKDLQQEVDRLILQIKIINQSPRPPSYNPSAPTEQ
jgi:hypothetical protein